ncbi:MAG: orotidine-5'-phosphate decarboxylase [Gammaproteobacteria bacterium]
MMQQKRGGLIVALDVPRRADALKLVEELGDAASFYKIGLELFAAGEGRQLLDDLAKRDLSVFADLKLFDVPATVARATATLANSGAKFLTVHGNDAMMAAAAKAKGDLKILAVTALTSLDAGDMNDLGFDCNVRDVVLSRARRALACGCDGVVSSGLEVAALRAECGEKLILVTPGVRPVINNEDDQKRTSPPGDIIRSGGDYVVVGRPIRDAKNPRAAAMAINAELAAAVKKE